MRDGKDNNFSDEANTENINALSQNLRAIDSDTIDEMRIATRNSKSHNRNLSQNTHLYTGRSSINNNRIQKHIYVAYFGLKAVPFSISPDPAFFVPLVQYQEALAHLLLGLESNGIVMLTGAIGVGKTTTIRSFLQRSQSKKMHISNIIATSYSSQEFLLMICDSFNIAYDLKDEMSVRVMLRIIQEFLMRCHIDGTRCVLMIDEAQALSDEVFEIIRTITNIETNDSKLLQIVLIGQPELNKRLSSPKFAAIEQRIIARYHLRNLELNEVHEYISGRLAYAGCTNPIFTTDAFPLITRLTNGSPRNINILCDHVMMAAYASSTNLINSALINTIYLEQEVNRRSVKRDTQQMRALSRNSVVWKKLRSFIADNWIISAMSILSLVFLGLFIWLLSTVFLSQDNKSTVATPIKESTISTLDQGTASKNIESKGTENEAELLPKNSSEKLMQLWGVKSLKSPCQDSMKGWKCQNIKLSSNTLWKYNIPLLFKWNGSEALLIRANKTFATIWIDGKEIVIDRKVFSEQWKGNAKIIIPIPDSFVIPLKLGSNAPFIRWINDRLAILENKIAPAQRTYDKKFLERVHKFQVDHGLGGIGNVFGLISYIRLQQLTNPQFIKLAEDSTQ